VIIVATVGILGFIYLPTDPLIARFSDLAHTDDIMTADVRAQIWRDTTRMFYAYPWFGCGWGAYQWTFLRFKTVAPMNTVDYAHNDYLQILVEAGVFVFLAGMIFVLRVLYRVLRAPAWSYSPDERYFAIACAGSISAILLHSFVDFNLYVPANAIVFSWVLGFSAVHLRRCTRRQP
jgi:O-antigen ligase